MSIDRLTALDRLMLRASRRWPQDIGALADPRRRSAAGRGPAGSGIEAVRDAVHRRLHLVPRFRQLIDRSAAGPRRTAVGRCPDVRLWAATCGSLPLEPPAGEAEMLAAVEQLLRQRLDPSRPLWEMWFLTGLPERRVGLFVKIHHTIADGMAAMTTIAAFLDPAPKRRRRRHRAWRPAPWPSAAALLADNLVRRLRPVGRLRCRCCSGRGRRCAQVRAAWPAIRELLAEEPATATSLDRMVGPDRSLALVRSQPRCGQGDRPRTRRNGQRRPPGRDCRRPARAAAEPRRAGRGHDGTVYVPVSLRRRLRGPQQGNLIAQMAVPLHLGERRPGSPAPADRGETTGSGRRGLRTTLGDADASAAAS